jgi:hypothetical protein
MFGALLYSEKQLESELRVTNKIFVVSGQRCHLLMPRCKTVQTHKQSRTSLRWGVCHVWAAVVYPNHFLLLRARRVFSPASENKGHSFPPFGRTCTPPSNSLDHSLPNPPYHRQPPSLKSIPQVLQSRKFQAHNGTITRVTFVLPSTIVISVLTNDCVRFRKGNTYCGNGSDW